LELCKEKEKKNGGRRKKIPKPYGVGPILKAFHVLREFHASKH
jgi:hypothetical protein